MPQQGLYALAPAAQPMGQQDMLARLLRGNPDPSLPGYPVMQSAEGRPMFGSPYQGAELQERLAAFLRGELQLDPNGVTAMPMMRRQLGGAE